MPSYDPDRDGGTNNGATSRRLNDKIVIHPFRGSGVPVLRWRAGGRPGAVGLRRPVTVRGAFLPRPGAIGYVACLPWLCRRLYDYQQVSGLRTIPSTVSWALVAIVCDTGK
jgi:hypothetical protein